MRYGRYGLGLLVVVSMLACAALARAQQCDDSNVCTTTDMCSDGECVGSPQNGGGCDDGNPCTSNDQCIDGECMGTPQTGGQCDDANPCTSGDQCFNGICLGPTPAAEDTPCADGCGQCKEQFPGVPFLTCKPRPDAQGQSCGESTNPCLPLKCQVVLTQVFCNPQPKVCPDTDGNKCTDNCNFETGECEVDLPPPCFPGCEECNPSVGCEPANLGGACDDFDVCTSQSHCEAVTVPGVGTRGFCLPGAPTITVPSATPSPSPSSTPTATHTAAPATATATASVTPTATPSASRTPTPTGTTAPVNTATHTASPIASPTSSSTPTRTATPTGTMSDTATATPTSGTPGAETPTPTSTPSERCLGDCDGDGEVSIDELIVAVEVALGLRPSDDCISLDADRSGTIEIDELVAAVNAAVNGC